MSSTASPALLAPEILAPAGNDDSLDAALRAGADAVYFGVPGFNARARAANFSSASLDDTIDKVHAHGSKAYVTLNTLVFDEEMAELTRVLDAIAHAGADAVIVQDLGVLELVRQRVPSLAIHASTQMTVTDAASAKLVQRLGARRVVLARELSVEEIAAIAAASDIELEVFVHGALCVAYSGQCLTSEAIGGRSANRGACAQACRLPYELVVDGKKHDLGERAYLLSPEDLEASAQIPALMRAGVRSLKIEGRLKGPDYVAATVALYKASIARALDQAIDEGSLSTLRQRALATYTRGSGPGFLAGIDHQRLVEARHPDHVGLHVGESLGSGRDAKGHPVLLARLHDTVTPGDGVLVEGGFGGEGEFGGRVWSVQERADGSAEIGFERGKSLDSVRPARRLYRTSSPRLEREIEHGLQRRALHLHVRGRAGEPLHVTARSERFGRVVGDLEASVESRMPMQPAASGKGLSEALLRSKLGSLGDTAFELGQIALDVDGELFLPPSELKAMRRTLITALTRGPLHTLQQVTPSTSVLAAPPPGGLYVLCRNEAQAEAALAAGADGVYLDFLELTGTGPSLRRLRAGGARFVGVAAPRIQKPGEEKIRHYLEGLAPDAELVRSLGALGGLEADGTAGARLRIADFSLNAANAQAARQLLGRGLAAFVPSFDLDEQQLLTLLDAPELGARAEVIVHHPMPLFHMEHCVFAALLSDGGDYKTCGRPCERHEIGLTDRAGMEHPVLADVGCRNTVFHAHPQSAARLVGRLRERGVGRFRIELVREDVDETRRLVAAYRALIDGSASPDDLWRELRTELRYGVVKGSLRVLA